MVFLHGFGGKASDWRHYVQHLAPRYRVIALDLRGHGKSETSAYVQTYERDYGDWMRARYNRDAAAPMEATTMHYFDIAEANRELPKPSRKRLPLTINLFVSDLKTTLKEMEVDRPFILIGHSLGGAIALSFARQQPDDVEKLILFNTPKHFRLKPTLQLILNLPDWQSRLVLSVITPWSVPSALRNVYENSLREWDADLYLQELKLPVLPIQTGDGFLQLRIGDSSGHRAGVLQQIEDFINR